MRILPTHLLLVALTGLAAGCANRRPRMTMLSGPSCVNAPARLNAVLGELQEALSTPGGCDPDGGRHCETLQSEIARLALNCPTTPEVLMANAILAFQSHDLVRSQQLLDQLLSLDAKYPEAVSLRARIALQEGNLHFAIRFLQEQLRRFGDNPGIHETYASALYLSHLWNDARVQLGIAAKLGAPDWRISFGLGLIDESQGLFAQAKAHYEEALRARPNWKPPEARLRALIAEGKVSP